MSDTNFSVKIPPKGFEELSQLAEHVAILKDVIDVVGEADVTANAAIINKAIADKIGVDVKVAALLHSGLATLRNLMVRQSTTAQVLLDAISKDLPREAPVDLQKNILSRWPVAEPAIAAVLDSISLDHPIMVRQKAHELTYAHQNIFRRSRIITDVRPVFNHDGTDIKAMVLTHVLSVEYFDGVRRQRIEFALDESDVSDLRTAAERRQQKTTTTRQAFQSHHVALLVAGDTNPEST